jgi:hypothetical protein
VAVPLLNTAVLDPAVQSQATAVAGLLSRSIAQSAATQAVGRYGVSNVPAADVAAGIRDLLESLTDAYLQDQLGGALTAAQNMGRAAVFDAVPPTTLQASELLDSNCCEPCSAIDGTEYGSLDDAQGDYASGGYVNCEGGERCRGTLVAIWDEAAPSAADAGDESVAASRP